MRTICSTIRSPRSAQAFQGVAHPFLRWNARAVVRRQFKKGEEHLP